MRAVRTQSQGLGHVQIAEQQADLLLTERGPTRPPVGARVATRLPGVRVIKRSDLPRPATLVASGTRWLIILDSSLGDREALYFKLRELKHLLDSTEPHVSGSEWHRHQFAVSVLMPRAWVARDYLRGLRDPELLARRYRVPPDAMRDRLRDLALWDGQPETEDRS